MTATEATVNPAIERLMHLPEDEFRDIVDADLRRRARRDDAEALRSPELVDRWFAALTAMAKSVEGQLAAREEDFRSRTAAVKAEMGLAVNDEQVADLRVKLHMMQADYSRGRSGTLRFKSGLEEWIIEARYLRDNQRGRMYDSIVAEERNHALARVRELEAAIQEHRDNFGPDDDVTPEDEKLWQVLR
jgi:hypothetical protein